MTLCNNNHAEICFEGNWCPICYERTENFINMMLQRHKQRMLEIEKERQEEKNEN